ncbi:hypothetical protein A2U01_0042595, partial [Trifolium medium]|nr:hypothetical protein [Trifolium medium]
IGSMELPELNERSAFLVRYELIMSEEVSSSGPTPCVIVAKRGFSPTDNTTKSVVVPIVE